MKKFALLFVVALFTLQCSEEERTERTLGDPSECNTRATVRDLRGLDGCGFVFELQDGTRLEPLVRFWCGTPPVTEAPADPLKDFEFVDGKVVTIGYEVTDMGSVCMVGPVVIINCISEVATQEPNQ